MPVVSRAPGFSCLVLLLCGPPSAAEAAGVAAVVETANLQGASDSADDPALWLHPSNSALSTVIATHKGYGIGVYGLDGAPLQSLAAGDVNNVDLRYGFPLGTAAIDLVAVSERSANVLLLYAVDPATRRLTPVSARTLTVGVPAIYGVCMYHSPQNGRFYAFVTSENGEVEQWELFDARTGRVDAVSRRRFDVGGITEGCAADDEQAFLFVGEENHALWRYGAEPGAGTARIQVDAVAPAGGLVADVEGLALYYTRDGGGYLIASSQGSNSFVAYQRRPPHARLLSFSIDAGAVIDGVTRTDGIEVSQAPMGSSFPGGVFVAHDDTNTGGLENFKLVPWPSIAALASPPLVVDTGRDPRGGGCGPADSDLDGLADGCDNCPTVRNGAADAQISGVGNQLDADADGVGDACDNCTHVPNAPLEAYAAFQTTTGGQLDDDADGWGNACDADFDQAGGVDSIDFRRFAAAFGRLRASATGCGGSRCDRYDLDETGANIDSRDFAVFKGLFGATGKQDGDRMDRCPQCGPPYPDANLPCEGDACP